MGAQRCAEAAEFAVPRLIRFIFLLYRFLVSSILPNGSHNKSLRPFLGIPHPATCVATVMRSMASAFADVCTVSSSKKLSCPHGVLGKAPTWRGSSAVFAEIV
jgi:hypothetical protein